MGFNSGFKGLKYLQFDITIVLIFPQSLTIDTDYFSMYVLQ